MSKESYLIFRDDGDIIYPFVFSSAEDAADIAMQIQKMADQQKSWKGRHGTIRKPFSILVGRVDLHEAETPPHPTTPPKFMSALR